MDEFLSYYNKSLQSDTKFLNAPNVIEATVLFIFRLLYDYSTTKNTKNSKSISQKRSWGLQPKTFLNT